MKRTLSITIADIKHSFEIDLDNDGELDVDLQLGHKKLTIPLMSFLRELGLVILIEEPIITKEMLHIK